MATRPPPPAPYETWLDFVVAQCQDHRIVPIHADWAAAELAELRAELAKLRQDFEELLELNNELIIKVTGINPTDPADEYLRTARKE